MRSYIAAFLGSFLLFAPVAFAADVSFTGSGYLQLNSLSGTPTAVMNVGEIITSIAVTGNTIALPVGAGATVGFTSATKMDVSVSPTAFFTLYESCSSSGTTWSAKSTADAIATVTFTLSAPGSCPGGGTGGGGSSGGGGGSSGGGGGSAAAVVALASAPAASPVPALISKLISAGFSRGLALGARGEDVGRLRWLLGLSDDSNVFDEALKEKLLAFQLKHKIVNSASDEGAGVLGPKTRAAILKLYPNKQAVVLVPNPDAKGAAQRVELQKRLNDLKVLVATLASQKKLAVPAPAAPAVAQPSPVAQAVSPVFNGNFGLGARGNDVNRLQQLLGVDPTGYYGNLTRQAVLKFQLENGVVKSEADQGAGRIGPATRAKLGEVFGGKKAVAPVTPATSTLTPANKQALQSQIDALKA